MLYRDPKNLLTIKESKVAADPLEGAREVPARRIAAPTSVSPEARAMLSFPGGPAMPEPRLDDHDGWRSLIAMLDTALLPHFQAMAAHVDAKVEQVAIAGVRVFDVLPTGLTDGESRLYIDIHGGGLVMGGGECCSAFGVRSAGLVAAHTWAVDYRMPPDHPYPAALDDCVSVYAAALETYEPSQVIIGGTSAGGNLAAATILRARDEGLPLPAAAILITPELDLTESGDSFQLNVGVDNVLPGSLMNQSLLYAGGSDLTDPYLSPLFGDFRRGFPPTFVQSGTRDLFLSNAVRMHRALRAVDIETDLHVFEAMPHGGFGGAPEDAELSREVLRFANKWWPRNG